MHIKQTIKRTLQILTKKGSYNLSMKSTKCSPDFHMPAAITTPSDFETAVKATGFGRFNIVLLLVAIPASMAIVFETGSVSLILPSAECDLNLNLVDKGILNAITFCGMITSSIGWGYLSDTKGRKVLLVSGFLIDVLCSAGSVLSQNLVQLMIAKFCGGFVMCGPFAILMSYISEFHGNKHRERIIIIIGVLFSTATLIMPILALLILPKDWNFDVFNMHFTSWKIFLAVCGIPAFFSGLLLCLFPETPRFLMSQGRNAEALEIFKTIYAINYGQPKDSYPIKVLVDENIPKAVPHTDHTAAIETGDSEENKNSSTAKALCFKPYFRICFMVCLMNFFILLGQVTVRLWLPQLFASLHDYEQISTEDTISMCNVLAYNVNRTEIMMKHPKDKCVVVITSATYANNIIANVVSFIGFLVATALINILGNKRIQVITLVIAGTSGFALYWSSTSLSILIVSSLYVCMSCIASITTISTSVNLFPTYLRTMIVSLSWMFGRTGSILGNILFPVFMSFGCIPPFLLIGSVMFIGAILSLTLPNTKKVDLK